MIGANAILSSIQNIADIGYAVGGVLVFALGYDIPFYIDGATFLFSFAMIWLTRIPSPSPGPLPDVRAVLRRIADGVIYTYNHPFLRWTTATFFIAPLAGGAAFVIGPLYAARVLSHSSGLLGPLTSGAFRFSVLEVGIGIGALLGSILVSQLAGRVGRGRLVAIGIAGTGLSDVPLAFTSNLYLATAMMVSAGIFTSLGVVPALTLVQKLTPTDVRGRVVAARLTVINGGLALGSALGGAAVAVLTFRQVWLFEAALIVTGSLFAWIPPTVRRQE
jgi:predicted MFS family arabinose efflux permease